jgi:hypothetical protein
MLGGGCSIAGGIEAGNGMTSLVDHLSMNVCEQADRRATSWTQLYAVEGRLFDRSEAAIGAVRGCRGSEFPLIFTSVEILVRAGLDETVEAADCSLQLVRSIPSFAASSGKFPARETDFGTSLPIGRLAKEYFFRYCASKMR